MIYNWLNTETSKILINMIVDRIKVCINISNDDFSFKNSIGMKLLSFTINGNVYTIVISDDGIKYSKDFDHQLNGINQQVINYIISEERNSKLNQLGI